MIRHADTAALRLREALHFHRFQPSSTAVAGYAKLAGEYAAYAGVTAGDLIVGRGPVTAEALTVEPIRAAFEAQRVETLDLLAGVHS